MGFLKRLFCRHELEFVRNIYGDEIIERGWKRSLWRCQKCGAVVEKDELHNAKVVGLAEGQSHTNAVLEG